MGYAKILSNAIASVSRAESFLWLQQSLLHIEGCEDTVNELAILLAQARREMGEVVLADDVELIPSDDGDVDIRSWSTATASRVLLILTGIHRHDGQCSQLIMSLYQYGDANEREAITQGLSLFNGGETLLPIALETGRANSLSLLSSLMINNPFPAAHYSEQQFNQMVLKSLFTGINIEQIHGLKHRVNVELARMCEDYVQERIDANRSVPADIWLAIAPHASQRGRELLQTFMQQGGAEHRHYAQLSLSC